MPDPLWLCWVLTVTGILLAGSRLAGLIGPWPVGFHKSVQVCGLRRWAAASRRG